MSTSRRGLLRRFGHHAGEGSGCVLSRGDEADRNGLVMVMLQREASLSSIKTFAWPLFTFRTEVEKWRSPFLTQSACIASIVRSDAGRRTLLHVADVRKLFRRRRTGSSRLKFL